MAKRGKIQVENSAGGVVIRRIDGVDHVPLIRDPYENWGLPKGHVEDGESPGEAALREVSEETGLSDLELGEELATIDWYFRAGEQLIHKFCVFFPMTSSVGEPVPEEGEGISECVWVRLDAADGQISYDNAREVVRAARKRFAPGPPLPPAAGPPRVGPEPV